MRCERYVKQPGAWGGLPRRIYQTKKLGRGGEGIDVAVEERKEKMP